MIFEETILYIKDNTGAMRQWSISGVDSLITITHGQVGGRMQYQTEYIAEGKVNRTVDEQMESRINSRISKQRDKGYIDDYDVASASKPVNAIGMPKPMLAKKLSDVKAINWMNAVTQPKYDGNRCIIYKDNGVIYAYSRNGKPITSIGHIFEDINMPDGTLLDGELYCHGYPLQSIVSWVKREQENTLKLKYHLYDVMIPKPYRKRSEAIGYLPMGDSIDKVPSIPVVNLEEAMTNFRAYRKEGYEGAIIRWGETGYEDGKRSNHLVKIKEWHDDEFTVVDIHESADGWGILECQDEDGNTFRVSAPGTISDKINVWESREDYLYKEVTVEYANLTQDGIPFHPVAICFREEIQ